MAPRTAAGEAGSLERAVSPAAQATGGPDAALNTHYDRTDANLSTLGADAGLGAVKGLEMTVAKQVAHEVRQANTEAWRYGKQAPAAASAAFAFYHTAVNVLVSQFQAHRVSEAQVKEESGEVVKQARLHAVTSELPDETGAKHEVGALQSMAAGVVPGDAASLKRFDSEAKSAAAFMSVTLPNLGDVEKILSVRSANRLAPVIRFYARGDHEIVADLSGLARPRQLIVVPSDLKAQMKLGAAGPDVPAAAEAAGAKGFVGFWISNARLRRRAGASTPVAAGEAAWSAARAEARELWDGAYFLLHDRLYGLIRPAHLGGLTSSDRGLLRLAAIYRGRVDGLDSAEAPVLDMDLSALAEAKTHEALTGESSAGFFAGRADFRDQIASRSLDQIDRQLIEAMPGRALAYADRKSGRAVLLVKGVTPGESAALSGLLRDFEPRVEKGVWIGEGALTELAEGLRLITGREAAPTLAEDAVARAFSHAHRARSSALQPGARFVGFYTKNGTRWLVERFQGTLLFANPDTRSVRLAASLP